MKQFLRVCVFVTVLFLAINSFGQATRNYYYKKNNDKDDYYSRKGISDNFQFTVGAYLPSLDTNIRVDSINYGAGTDLNFENDLAMDSSLIVFRADAKLRLGRYIFLEGGYYNLYRDIQHVLNKQIQIGSEVYTANADITGFFETEVIKLALGINFVNDGSVEAGISLGANLVNLNVEFSSIVANTDQIIDELAPLPLAGAHVHVTLMPGLFVKGTLQFVAVTVEEIEGSALDLRAVFEYYPIKNVGFGAGINLFNFDISNVDFDIEGEPVIGSFNYGYTGLVGYISIVL